MKKKGFSAWQIKDTLDFQTMCHPEFISGSVENQASFKNLPIGATFCGVLAPVLTLRRNGGWKQLHLDGFTKANPSALLLSNLFYKFVRSLRSQRRYRNASGGLTARPAHRLPHSHTPTVGSCSLSAVELSSTLAFTLAEVLITLAIIGVVAALTIPAVVRNYKETQTVVQLRKNYSILSQAYNMAIAENGDPTGWDLKGLGNAEGGLNFLDKMRPYLKIIKECKTTKNGCFARGYYKDLNGKDASYIDPGYQALIRLADGTGIAFQVWRADCDDSRACAFITVDLNGDKKPNQYGVDTFIFLAKKAKLAPQGIKGDAYGFGNWCNLAKSSVADSNYNGVGCGAWVIINENMDYLKCNDLSWDGKRKCN